MPSLRWCVRCGWLRGPGQGRPPTASTCGSWSPVLGRAGSGQVLHVAEEDRLLGVVAVPPVGVGHGRADAVGQVAVGAGFEDQARRIGVDAEDLAAYLVLEGVDQFLGSGALVCTFGEAEGIKQAFAAGHGCLLWCGGGRVGAGRWWPPRRQTVRRR